LSAAPLSVTRYRVKAIANESTKGTDVLAFRLTKKTDLDKNVYSAQDVLMSVEVKAQFSGDNATPRLQDAVHDSAKDQFRKALSLNAMKRRLQADADLANVKLVERFQNLADRPYRAQYTATAFHCTSNYEDSAVTEVDISKHPEKKNLSLLLVKAYISASRSSAMEASPSFAELRRQHAVWLKSSPTSSIAA